MHSPMHEPEVLNLSELSLVSSLALRSSSFQVKAPEEAAPGSEMFVTVPDDMPSAGATKPKLLRWRTLARGAGCGIASCGLICIAK